MIRYGIEHEEPSQVLATIKHSERAPHPGRDRAAADEGAGGVGEGALTGTILCSRVFMG